MDKIGDILEKWIMGFLGVLCCLLIVIGFAQVFFRYVLGYSLYWSEEAMRYLFIWVVFLGLGPTLRHKGHVALEIIPNSLGGRARFWLERLTLVLVLIFCLVLTWYGGIVTVKTFRYLSPAMEISLAFIYGPLPLGGLAAIFYTLEQIKNLKPSGPDEGKP